VVGDGINDRGDLGWGVNGIVIVPLVYIEGFFGVGSGGITNTVSVIALKKVVLHCLPCCHLHHSEKIHHGRGFKMLSTPVTQNPDEGEVVKKVVVKHKFPTPHNEVPVIAGCARWCHEVVVLALEAARCVCVVHVENHNEILKKSALNLKLGEVLNIMTL